MQIPHRHPTPTRIRHQQPWEDEPQGGEERAIEIATRDEIASDEATQSTSTSARGEEGQCCAGGPLNWLVRVVFGSKTSYSSVFLLLIVWTYGLQGFRLTSTEKVMFWTAMRQGANPAVVEAAIGTLLVPAVFKAFYGLLADSVPVCGRHIKPYYMASALLVVLCLASVALSDVTPTWTTMFYVLVTMNVGENFMDVLADALVVREARAKGSGSSEMQSIAMFCIALGAMMSAFISGTLFDAGLHRAYMAALAVAQSLALILMLAYRERPTQKRLDRSVVREICSNISQVLRTVAKPICYRPMLWYFMQHLCSFSLVTPNSWMRRSIGFSEGEIQYAGAVNYLFFMAGTVVYARFFTRVTFRKLWGVTTIVMTLLILPDYIQASRLNVKWGIPDWLFLYGSDGFTTFIDRIYSTPFHVMCAQLCPPGVEALMFACLMSWNNLANSCSRHLGAAVQAAWGITADNYRPLLPSLIIVKAASTLLPLFFLFLVPNTASILTDAQKEEHGCNYDQHGSKNNSSMEQQQQQQPQEEPEGGGLSDG
ncbi:unnamed protein product [Vitrella brassicaformis CCMP3155]|uniref:Folate/biopterin transporter n=1 Tax=Vitrella brassicaformis (strain CCMP3155) TaxID=1169540 RepID=A0A0G4ENZ2_VITBC|nr:unnamed protein product [Vitrella brassicaformis CCMP3155]|eukprot:CEL99343.1 unnamed protein product [Vitrella brassicaformis CCMP3155]